MPILMYGAESWTWTMANSADQQLPRWDFPSRKE